MRPLHFVYVLTLIGQSGFRGYRLVLALYALHLGASAFRVGVLLAVYSLMQAAAGWWAGRWSDRAGCYRPMLVGALAGVAGFCISYIGASEIALFAAAAVVGVAYAMVHVAQTNVVGLLSKPDERAKNLADLSLVFSLTNFAGPLLAGFSVEVSGHAAASLWFVVLSLASTLALVAGKRLLPAQCVHTHGEGDGLRELLKNRALLRVLMIGSLVFAAVDVFQFYMPVYAHGLGLPAFVVGVIMACFPAAAFTSRVCLRWLLQYMSPEGVLWRAFLLATAAFVSMPLFDGAISLGVLAFVYGFGLCVGQPITLILAYQNATGGRTGEAVGIREAVNQITRVVAPLVFGAIGSVAGMLPVFFAGGGMLACGALLLRAGRQSTPASGGR
ncbi:MAG: MFS transporter [Betaproteobacteria bacterium]|nr:MAG: MFS transporter [Betaproteobacteria bacterium]